VKLPIGLPLKAGFRLALCLARTRLTP